MQNISLTKYEKVRLIGLRATQIANGAKPTVKVEGLTNPIDIALKEYSTGQIPICIIRNYPNGKKISVSVTKS